MAYTSRWNGYEERTLLGCGVYPIKQSPKSGSSVGPAPALDPTAVNEETGQEEPQDDLLDEALQYFKPHMLFRTYKIKGNADRLTLYLTSFIHTCLKRLVGVTKDKAKGVLTLLAQESPIAPCESTYPFHQFFPAPTSPAEVEQWKEYAKQLRLEMVVRVAEKAYQFPEADGTPNKFWLIFAKQGLLGQTSGK